jgi:hypothetical protein
MIVLPVLAMATSGLETELEILLLMKLIPWQVVHSIDVGSETRQYLVGILDKGAGRRSKHLRLEAVISAFTKFTR